MTHLELKRGILLGVALGLLGSMFFSCATHLEERVDLSNDAHATGEEHAKADVDATSAEIARTVREGGELDLKDYYPDGKLKRELHRAPVKTTRDTDKHDQVKAALESDAKSLLNTDVDVDADTTKDSKPSFSVLGFLGLGWLKLIPLIIIGVIVLLFVALLVFRKSGLVQRLAKTLPFPFSLLAIALPAPAETPKE